jgi:transposase
VRSWTSECPAIASPRSGLTDRAGRWATEQVGRWGRTVNEVAVELGCDWHTINDTVVAYGAPLVEDPDRIGEPTPLGLDETLFFRLGPWRRQCWSTSIVDVEAGRLLDVVPGRSGVEPCRWLAERGERGWPTSGGRRWTCPGPNAPCSTPWFPTPPRSPTRFMW